MNSLFWRSTSSSYEKITSKILFSFSSYFRLHFIRPVFYRTHILPLTNLSSGTVDKKSITNQALRYRRPTSRASTTVSPFWQRQWK